MSEKEVLFNTLAQSSPDCIKLFDTDGKMLFINNGGLAEHNYASVEEAKVRDFMSTMVPASQETFKKAFAAALRGEATSIEVAHTKEGSNREFCLETITPIRGADNIIAGVIGFSRDVTKYKRMEKELEEKVDDLMRANKVMIGRELKMIELKNEIEELKKKVSSA